MSTQLGLNRKFEKNADGKVIRRETPLPTFTKEVGTCPICGEPVMAAPGQAVRTGAHKACRKKAGIKKTDTVAVAMEKATFERQQQARKGLYVKNSGSSTTHEQQGAKVA